MKTYQILVLTFILFLVESCGVNHTSRIETFQRLETYWDQMLLEDMKREASTINSIDFRFNVANTTEEQIDQIRRAIRQGTETIVVNPYDEKSFIPIIEEAYDAGVNVVLVGQKISTFKYHAYSGIDNEALGKQAATYVCNLLKGKGNIIMVQSFRDAPFYNERYESFRKIIDHQPGVNIVGTVEGQWDNDITHKQMDSLKMELRETPVDLVYSFGSMVIGAIESETYPDAIFVGSDGVPGECLTGVQEGWLQATFLILQEARKQWLLQSAL